MKLRAYVLLFAVTLSPAIAAACTVCDSATGQQVRAGIIDNGFWTTLLGVTAPFPVLLLIIAAYHYGIPDLRISFRARLTRSAQTQDAL